MEEIRTDNTETLKNALERIKELEKENAALKETVTKMNNVVIGTFSKLTKAKNHIHRLLVLLIEGKRSYAVIDEARAFLQEESE